jgi:hypothetical protein
MRRSIAQLWIFAGLAALMGVLVLAALAARAETPTGSEAATGKNIFSTPDADEGVARFNNVGPSGSPRAKLRQALLGSSRDNIPDFRQIQMLPTLTLQQRRQLRELNKDSKQKVQPLVESLKKLRDQRDTAGGAVTPEMRAQLETLRTQLQALRKQSWEQSKSLLTDSQIRDIQAMKRGELEPSTFRGNDSASASAHDDSPMMMKGQ